MKYKYKSSVINVYFILNTEGYEQLSKIFEMVFIDSSNSITIDSCLLYHVDNENVHLELWINGNQQIIKDLLYKESIPLVLGILDYFLDSNNQYMSLHASSVTVRNKNICFLNTSGAGKTTATLTLLYKLSEASYFADDRIMVDRDLSMHGIKNAISIKEGTKKLLDISDDELTGPLKKNELVNYWYYLYKGKIDNKIINIPNFNVIFLNVMYDTASDFDVNEVQGIEKMKIFINNCYNIASRSKECYNILLKMSRHCRVFCIKYSNNDKLIQFVEQLGE